MVKKFKILNNTKTLKLKNYKLSNQIILIIFKVY